MVYIITKYSIINMNFKVVIAPSDELSHENFAYVSYLTMSKFKSLPVYIEDESNLSSVFLLKSNNDVEEGCIALNKTHRVDNNYVIGNTYKFKIVDVSKETKLDVLPLHISLHTHKPNSAVTINIPTYIGLIKMLLINHILQHKQNVALFTSDGRFDLMCLNEKRGIVTNDTSVTICHWSVDIITTNTYNSNMIKDIQVTNEKNKFLTEYIQETSLKQNVIGDNKLSNKIIEDIRSDITKNVQDLIKKIDKDNKIPSNNQEDKYNKISESKNDIKIPSNNKEDVDKYNKISEPNVIEPKKLQELKLHIQSISTLPKDIFINTIDLNKSIKTILVSNLSKTYIISPSQELDIEYNGRTFKVMCLIKETSIITKDTEVNVISSGFGINLTATKDESLIKKMENYNKGMPTKVTLSIPRIIEIIKAFKNVEVIDEIAVVNYLKIDLL